MNNETLSAFKKYRTAMREFHRASAAISAAESNACKARNDFGSADSRLKHARAEFERALEQEAKS